MWTAKRIYLMCCVLAIAAIALFLVSGPTLVSIRTGPLTPSGRVVFLNPIRDRRPEAFAAQILGEISAGRCEQAMKSAAIPVEEKDKACRKQTEYPILAPCRLIRREDKRMQTWLVYFCAYRGGGDAHADVVLTVEQTDGQFRLAGFERIY